MALLMNINNLSFCLDKLPPPHAEHYNGQTSLLSWNPPLIEPLTDTSVHITLAITHYKVYVTDMETEHTMNFTSETDATSIVIANNMMSCSAFVQVSAVNHAGEGQRSTGIKVNCKAVSCAMPSNLACNYPYMKVGSVWYNFSVCGGDQNDVTSPDVTTGFIPNSRYEQDTAEDSKKVLSSKKSALSYLPRM